MWFPFSIVFHCVKNQLSNENQRSAMNGGDVYWEESQNKNSQWEGRQILVRVSGELVIRVRVVQVLGLSGFLLQFRCWF